MDKINEMFGTPSSVRDTSVVKEHPIGGSDYKQVAMTQSDHLVCLHWKELQSVIYTVLGFPSKSNNGSERNAGNHELVVNQLNAESANLDSYFGTLSSIWLVYNHCVGVRTTITSSNIQLIREIVHIDTAAIILAGTLGISPSLIDKQSIRTEASRKRNYSEIHDDKDSHNSKSQSKLKPSNYDRPTSKHFESANPK
tara:strand:+ start:4650 stop:5240 length:591 start_codon:yes stop_codon:yes gene_type:complete